MKFNNLNYIYNEKYIVIVPKMSIEYLESLEYSFGNTIIFDNKKDLSEIINFINFNNFSQIIFVDYQLEYEDIIKNLKSKHDIKIVFTKSIGAFSNSFIYSIFKGVIGLYEKNYICSIGVLDEGLFKTLKNKNVNCYYINLDIAVNNENNSYNKGKIGILNTQDNPMHSFYNELSALKFNNYTAKLCNVGKETKRFLSLFGIKHEIKHKKDDVYKENLVNLYINFTDNNNLIFLKSMDCNVPCILGNNELLKNEKYLSTMLVVESDDSIDEISSKIELVKKNRKKILEEYKAFRKKYSKKSHDLITDFLGCEKVNESLKNKDELLLSIVVPVYNTRDFLNKSLKSIIKAIPNKIKNRSEILIINDGSKDDSENIILKYKKRYPKLINYIKQNNHGLGNVRNVGLKKAKGKYIASIDSDDTINKNFFKKALVHMKNDVDVIVCDWLSITNDAKFETSAIEWIFKDLNYYEGLLYTTIMPSSCNKIIKKSMYDNLKIKFMEDKYEDLSTNPFVMLSAKKIKYINKPYYEYFIRSNSIMRSSAGYSMIDVLKEFDVRLNKYSSYINVDVEKFKFYTYSWRIEEFIFNQLYDLNLDELKRFIDYLYSNLYDVVKEIINNEYYDKMLNNITAKKSKFVSKRNKAFLKKELLGFINESLKSKKYYKITTPMVYFGESKNNE